MNKFLATFNRFLLALLLICAHLTSQANDSLYFDVSTIAESKQLATHAKILEDQEKAFSLSEIISGKFKQEFYRPADNVPYMDFTCSTFWMKLNVENRADKEQKFFIELARPLTNIVELYVLNQDDELIESFKTGDDSTFANRPYIFRKFIFPLVFPSGEKRKLIVKTSSDGEILKLPIKFSRENAFTEFIGIENFLLGLFYGFLALVIILFFFFGIALRQKVYSIFVFYVFSIWLFQFSLDGFAYQYLWPNISWLGNHAILIFAAFSIIALLAYADNMLGFHRLNKNYYRIYKLLYLFAILGLIASFLSGPIYSLAFPVLNGLSVLMVFYFFIGIYLKYRKNEKPSIALSAAFVFLWLGAMLFVLSNVNIINSEFLAANVLKIGTATEVTFLSIAMAGRYRENQREKIKAQNEAYARLEEMNILKNEQTEKLEAQVNERTKEITEKNTLLSNQNKEIINSINYAKKLQNAILPSKKLFEDLFKESGILYLPKDIVSGDFYWLEKNDDYVFFAVADCTGHGVPGALVSVVGYNGLNRCVNEMKLTDAGLILDQLTIMMEQTFSKSEFTMSDGMDISLCIWDYKDNLQFAGAFNPIYLIRDQELIEYKANKQPIGKFIKRESFTRHDLNLKNGDSIYLFSDGYADQFGGEKGKKLKYSNFKKHLLRFNEQAANTIDNEMRDWIREWQDSEEQIDDICIMNIRF